MDPSKRWHQSDLTPTELRKAMEGRARHLKAKAAIMGRQMAQIGKLEPCLKNPLHVPDM